MKLFLCFTLLMLITMVYGIAVKNVASSQDKLREKRWLTSNNYNAYKHVYCFAVNGRCKDRSGPDQNGCCGAGECIGDNCNYCESGCRGGTRYG